MYAVHVRNKLIFDYKFLQGKFGETLHIQKLYNIFYNKYHSENLHGLVSTF